MSVEQFFFTGESTWLVLRAGVVFFEVDIDKDVYIRLRLVVYSTVDVSLRRNPFHNGFLG